MTSSTDRHSQLVEAGWRCRIDGLWKSPEPADRRAFTLATAWVEHSEQTRTQRGE